MKKNHLLISGKQNIYIGVPHTYTFHISSAKVTGFKVFVRHLKSLPRRMGLERSSRMNQESPNSQSLAWIPQEVPILSGCSAAWPPRVSWGLSPHIRRIQGRNGHQLLPQQGLQQVQSSSLLLRNSSPSPCLCLISAPMPSPLHSQLWGQNVFCPNTTTQPAYPRRLKTHAEAVLPWGRAEWPFLQGSRVRAGLVPCEVLVWQLRSAQKQLCFPPCPAQCSPCQFWCLVHC